MELIFACCNSKEEQGELYSKLDRKSFIVQPVVHTYQNIGVDDEYSMYRKVQNIQTDVITIKLSELKNQTQIPIKIHRESLSKSQQAVKEVSQKQIINYRTILPFSFSKDNLKQNQSDSFLAIATALSLLSQKSAIINSIISQQQNSLGLNLKIEGKIYKIAVIDHHQHNNVHFEQQRQTKIINNLILIVGEGIKKIYEKNGECLSKGNTVEQIIEAITFAPNLRIQIKKNKKKKQNEELWSILNNQLQMNKIIICKTKLLTVLPFLEPNSSYLLVSIDKNQDEHGKQIKNICIQSAYQDFSKNIRKHTFSFTFEEFLQHFTTLYINTYFKSSYWAYHNFQYYKTGKGDHFQLLITDESIYNIKITQSSYHSQQLKPPIRSTLILFQKQPTSYQYLNGSKTKQQLSTTLSAKLKPGKYIIYCKIDKQVEETYPDWAKVQVYSQSEAQLLPVKDFKYKSLLLKGFLAYADKNRRQLYDHGSMWMSFEQLQNCDYAYVAFGNKIGSTQKFKVSFNEQDFHKCGYKLKKPFKGKKMQQLFIHPGEQRIILCRKINDQSHPTKFPPKMQIAKIPKIQSHTNEHSS